jgi:D-alanine-D-alanine ligase-like ATP-grasp enzyme
VAENEGKVIYKGTSSYKTRVQRWNPQDEERLASLRHAPVLFQREIRGPEVRVHVVEDDCFAEAIISDRVDYRFDRDDPIKYATIEIPAILEEASLAIAAESGASFVGIDYRIDNVTGRWYFLELNSMPAYHGYDTRAGGAISKSLIKVLTSN